MRVSGLIHALHHSKHNIYLSSSREHQNGLSAGGEAEAVVEAGATRRQLVAAMAAPRTVAELNVVRCGKAVRPRGEDASGATVVHGARAAAGAADAGAAVVDHGVLRGAWSEWIDRLADEGELGVGGLEPVHHLVVRHEVVRRLCRKLVSIVQS